MKTMGQAANSMDKVVLVAKSFGSKEVRHAPRVVEMSEPVVRRLALLGHAQPVLLSALPGKWWSINVDLAALDEANEPGCGYRCIDATSEAIGANHALYWCEIVAGPFDQEADATATYLASIEFDAAWLGPRAAVGRVEPWVCKQLQARGLTEPYPLTAVADAYWVCGMGGGVCATQELAKRVRRFPGEAGVTHGPFDNEDDAHYAFDVMWESPE
ncbi:MAG: hypothetical protein J0M00_06530 [Burkholderiales bacterium]|nr:hypothetical protein [Burkholderiales bacterium]